MPALPACLPCLQVIFFLVRVSFFGNPLRQGGVIPSPSMSVYRQKRKGELGPLKAGYVQSARLRFECYELPHFGKADDTCDPVVGNTLVTHIALNLSISQSFNLFLLCACRRIHEEWARKVQIVRPDRAPGE